MIPEEYITKYLHTKSQEERDAIWAGLTKEHGGLFGQYLCHSSISSDMRTEWMECFYVRLFELLPNFEKKKSAFSTYLHIIFINARSNFFRAMPHKYTKKPLDEDNRKRARMSGFTNIKGKETSYYFEHINLYEIPENYIIPVNPTDTDALIDWEWLKPKLKYMNLFEEKYILGLSPEEMAEKHKVSYTILWDRMRNDIKRIQVIYAEEIKRRNI